MVSVSGTNLLAANGSQIATVTSALFPLTGVGSGMMITVDSGEVTLWCSTPSWRGLDVNTTLGVTLTAPVVTGSGRALLLTSGVTTWAFSR